MTEQQSAVQLQQLIEHEALRQLKLQADDEIDLKEVFLAVWKAKWLILIITLLAVVIGVFYSLSLPNKYRAEVLLASSQESKSGGMSELASRFGGLAAVAGINLTGPQADKATIALETIKGKVFIADFVKKYKLKPVLMAAKTWDKEKNTLNFNESIYDPKTGVWLINPKNKASYEPSDLQVHRYFIGQSLSVYPNNETGLVTISVEHISPYVAKEIVDKLVLAINDKLKSDDIRDANNSIEYLKSALNQSPISDMQAVFYRLIEQQEQTKMLASVRDEYALKIINPSVVEESRVSPNRIMICIIAFFLGGAGSIFLVLLRYFYHKVRQ